MGSDHLPIEISIDAQPHRTYTLIPLGINLTRLTEKYLNALLKEALSSGDVPELKSTQDIGMLTLDKAILTSKSGRPDSQPVPDESLVLIKEKRRLRWQYSQAHYPQVIKDTY